MGKYDHWSCSGKTWTTRRRGDVADFNRWFKKGKEVWVVHEHATNLAAQFESHTCSRVIATGKDLFGNEGKSLLMTYGQVFETQPTGLRDLASPEPDCRDQGYGPPRSWATETRRLDRDEIDHMEKRAREAGNQYDADRKAGRRRWL
ncbi:MULTISPECIES: hypothetical protein [unclassified Streptomyces]|uniref:hypothetical protein n=1 Tax=unclassified Streptomyces TaxID=2593676 RepID=UPI00331A0E4D